MNTTFYKSLLEASYFSPLSLKEPYTWVGHTSFGYWLINQICPKNFVELGTHSGNSYFSFCQSVLLHKLPSSCFAVDTWRGDDHASNYEEEVFIRVSEINEKYYSSFSTLCRMTFDEALSNFSDSSIELLHIDGFHTYEAVRHDFETWLPKLAPGAIVLFHDTVVRENNFGVHKLWEELTIRYRRHMNFPHSYGLGVLQIDGELESGPKEWMWPSSERQAEVLQHFENVGRSVFNSIDKDRLEGLACSLESESRNLKNRLFETHQIAVERQEEIERLSLALDSRNVEYAQLHQIAVERQEEIERLSLALARNE